jgi:hypothetical protein
VRKRVARRDDPADVLNAVGEQFERIHQVFENLAEDDGIESRELGRLNSLSIDCFVATAELHEVGNVAKCDSPPATRERDAVVADGEVENPSASARQVAQCRFSLGIPRVRDLFKLSPSADGPQIGLPALLGMRTCA